MFAVGLLSLSTTPEAETAALAADLAVTAYEAGQLVRGLPSIVLRTADRAKADSLAAKLTKRGQQAVCCDLAQVISSDQMHHVRGFRLEPDALISENQNGTSERLAWNEVRCAIKAVHHVTEQATEVTRGRKFDLGRAVLTQGLVMTKGTEKETSSLVAQREPVLYLFRKSGTPWLLAESQGRYSGLGALVGPSRQGNFITLLRLIRERLPGIPWDERLVSMRARTENISTDLRGKQTGTSNTATADLFAHLIALTSSAT
jgi:hypothetical protein